MVQIDNLDTSFGVTSVLVATGIMFIFWLVVVISIWLNRHK